MMRLMDYGRCNRLLKLSMLAAYRFAFMLLLAVCTDTIRRMRLIPAYFVCKRTKYVSCSHEPFAMM